MSAAVSGGWRFWFNFKMKKKTFVNIIYSLIPVIAVVFAIVMITGTKRESVNDEELAESEIISVAEFADNQVGSGEATGELTEEITSGSLLEELEVEIPQKEIDWDDLHNQNQDVYAWIYVPGTAIDYPILQHPDLNDFYLEFNMDGTQGLPGCIYTQQEFTAKDFSDPLTVIYGHNMKNGSMFAGLHKYADKGFFDENRYIYIYTPEKTFVYEIFAAYEHTDELLSVTVDSRTKESFEFYLSNVLSRQCGMSEHIRNEEELGLSVDGNCRIVTLSTCISGKNDKRWLVQGVLVGDE